MWVPSSSVCDKEYPLQVKLVIEHSNHGNQTTVYTVKANNMFTSSTTKLIVKSKSWIYKSIFHSEIVRVTFAKRKVIWFGANVWALKLQHSKPSTSDGIPDVFIVHKQIDWQGFGDLQEVCSNSNIVRTCTSCAQKSYTVLSERIYVALNHNTCKTTRGGVPEVLLFNKSWDFIE